MNNRYKGWTDVAALDEHLTVFLKMDEALERFLGDLEPSSHEPYKISTDSGSVDRPSRAQISGAVDSLGGSLSSLEVWYTGSDTGSRVCLSTQPFPAWPSYRIGCSLHVFGDDENETNGRFDTLRNRMDAEIKRQWPKSTAAKQAIASQAATLPPTTTPDATSPSASGFKHRLDRVVRHPLWVTIIGPLVVAGVLALIGLLWKVYGR